MIDTLDSVATRVHSMTTRSMNHIIKPRVFHDDMIWYSLSHALLTTCFIFNELEPSLYTAASKDPAWRAAMHAEFDALLGNNTWKLVTPSSIMNIIGYHLVFKLKRCAGGFIEQHKACLVAKGYHQ